MLLLETKHDITLKVTLAIETKITFAIKLNPKHNNTRNKGVEEKEEERRKGKGRETNIPYNAMQ